MVQKARYVCLREGILWQQRNAHIIADIIVVLLITIIAAVFLCTYCGWCGCDCCECSPIKNTGSATIYPLNVHCITINVHVSLLLRQEPGTR